MHIPAYWVTDVREFAGMNFRVRGVSDNSMQEARARMEQHAAVLAAFHATGDSSPQAVEEMRRSICDLRAAENGGEYAVDVLEPIVERLDAQNIITRNRYGAEVLNSTSLCMVDVDSFADATPLLKRVAAMFGLFSYDKRQAMETALVAHLRALCAQQSDLGARLYRTAGGWRVMLQGQGITPDSDRMKTLARGLRADSLYMELCRKQQCWRARLTPKLHRLHLKGLGRYPRRTVSDTPATGECEWLQAYNEAGLRFGVCRLVDCFGLPVESPMVKLHDERTRASVFELPLR